MSVFIQDRHGQHGDKVRHHRPYFKSPNFVTFFFVFVLASTQYYTLSGVSVIIITSVYLLQ